jgi:hypothetical protein
MWWRGQNLDKPIVGPDGVRWHFRVWHDYEEGIYVQRLFFWNESMSKTGLAEFRGQRLHIRQIKSRLAKIAKDPRYRKQFLRPLQFPLERHW